MKIDLKAFAVLLLCVSSTLVIGCGGSGGPATPAPAEQTPTIEEPPPGEPEPTLPEEGP